MYDVIAKTKILEGWFRVTSSNDFETALILKRGFEIAFPEAVFVVQLKHNGGKKDD
jgi:hypothetical protein